MLSRMDLLVNHRLLLRSLGELEYEEKKKCLSLGIEQGLSDDFLSLLEYSISLWYLLLTDIQ